MVDIYAALRECYTIATKHCGGRDLMGVFLRGSQNYGTEGPDSDIDCIAVVIPTLEDVAIDREKISKTVESPYGLITVQDVRIVFKNLIKQKPNMLEILFTPYAVTNTDYVKFYHEMKKQAEPLCKADLSMLMAACLGILQQYCKNIDKDNGSEIFQACGYNPKMLANAYRMARFIKEYCKNENYEDAMRLTDNQIKNFYQLKYGVLCKDYEQAKKLCAVWTDICKAHIGRFEQNYVTSEGVHKDLATLNNFYQICVDLLRHAWDK